MTSKERKRLIAIRKKAGRLIDPKTAEVVCIHAQILDPYGLGGSTGGM
jgi:hypothetical protein